MVITDRSIPMPLSKAELEKQKKPFFDIKKSNIVLGQPKPKPKVYSFFGKKLMVDKSDDENE